MEREEIHKAQRSAAPTCHSYRSQVRRPAECDHRESRQSARHRTREVQDDPRGSWRRLSEAEHLARPSPAPWNWVQLEHEAPDPPTPKRRRSTHPEHNRRIGRDERDSRMTELVGKDHDVRPHEEDEQKESGAERLGQRHTIRIGVCAVEL